MEILSPDHRSGQMRDKLRDYFSADVKVVWVVDLQARRVLVYRSLTDITELRVGQALTDEELLPGFSLPISDLFPEAFMVARLDSAPSRDHYEQRYRAFD